MSGKGKGNAANPKSPGALGSQFQFSAKAVAAAKPKQNKLESTQHKFLALLDALNEEELEEFREFVREELDFRTFCGSQGFEPNSAPIPRSCSPMSIFADTPI